MVGTEGRCEGKKEREKKGDLSSVTFFIERKRLTRVGKSGEKGPPFDHLTFFSRRTEAEGSKALSGGSGGEGREEGVVELVPLHHLHFGFGREGKKELTEEKKKKTHAVAGRFVPCPLGRKRRKVVQGRGRKKKRGGGSKAPIGPSPGSG